MIRALLEEDWGCPFLNSSLENRKNSEKHFTSKVANIRLSEADLCLGEENVCMLVGFFKVARIMISL